MARGRKPNAPCWDKAMQHQQQQHDLYMKRTAASSIALDDVEALGLGMLDQMAALKMIGAVVIIEDDAERATATDVMLCEMYNKPELLPLMNSDAVKGLILAAALHRQQTAPEKATARKHRKEKSDTAAEAYEVAVMAVDLGVGELARRTKGDIAQELADLLNVDKSSFERAWKAWRSSPEGAARALVVRHRFDSECDHLSREDKGEWAHNTYQGLIDAVLVIGIESF